MNLRPILPLTIAFAVFLGSSEAAARHPDHRNGLTLGLALGGGWSQVRLSNRDQPWEFGPAGAFRLGYAFQNSWIAGLEFNGWRKTVDGTETHFSNTAVTGTFFPKAGSFFLRGGVGAGLGALGVPVDNDLGITQLKFVHKWSVAFLLGMGYEIRTHRSWALGFALDANVLPLGSVTSGEVTENVDVSYTTITASYTWYAL